MLKIYKASAGSGKTFTLAVEYIRILVSTPNPQEYIHTLAVTFTNKATAEMKDRILQQLYGIWKGLPTSKGYMKVLKEKLEESKLTLSDEVIRERAGNSLKAILHDYNMFRVETIDSFFQSVLNSLAHELGLSAGLQVDINGKEVVAHAVDRIIDNLQDDEQLRRWIMSYIHDRIDDDASWNVTSEMKDFANCIFQEKFLNRDQQYRDNLNNEDVIRGFRKKMRDILAEKLPPIQQQAKALDEHICGNSLGGYEFITRKGSSLKKFLESVISGKLTEPSSTIMGYADDASKLLTQKNQKDPAYMAEAQLVSAHLDTLLQMLNKDIVDITSAQMALKYLNPLRLLGVIEKTVADINGETNRFNLQQTPVLLRELIEEQDSPFVFEKAGTLFTHVMIDEFQDTSHMQWDNFQVLLLETQANAGDYMIVGDVKQSIYRFRNGDWEILDQLEHTAKRFDPKVEYLDFNRRSLRNVIEFNNRFFDKAPSLLDEIDPGQSIKIASIYEKSAQKVPDDKPNTGFVRLHLCTSKQKDYTEMMMQDMLKEVRTLTSNGLPLEKIAILVRKNKQATAVLDFFSREAPDINIVSDEAYLLESSLAVTMLINALRWLTDHEHTAIIQLRSLVTQYQKHVEKKELPSSQVLNYKETEALLPSSLIARKRKLATMPLYQCCEELYRELQLECLPKQDSYIMALFDRIQDFLKDHAGDAYTFLKAWDEGIHSSSIPSGQAQGIRILTVHKSKGLEFHTVMLPFCDADIEGDGTGKDNIHWVQPEDERNNVFGDLGALPLNVTSNMATSVFSEYYQWEHLQRRVDSLNTLYVAFTRAGSNLYVWGKVYNSEGNGIKYIGNLIYKCVPGLEAQTGDGPFVYEEGERVFDTPEKEDEYTRVNPLYEDLNVPMRSYEPKLMDFRQSGNATRFLKTMDKEENANDTATEYIQTGNLMHDILSHIRTKDDLKSAVEQAAADGLFEDEEKRNRILACLEKGLDNPQVATWFDGHWKVFNETSIIDPQGDDGAPEVCRPDRVIKDEKEILVIDYKTGRESDDYHDQVRHYMALISKMYPNHHVSGYLWYILMEKVEPVKQQQ